MIEGGITNETTRDNAITTIRFPIRLLTLVCLLTIMAFAWFSWIIFDKRRDAKMFTERLSRIEELRGVIVHLGEVLTMSSRMAAGTGDLQWEERYRRFEPQLDAAIKETRKIGTSPADIKAATKTDAANIKLIEMENRAFALIRAGRKEEAQAVLSSPEYETQKQIYAEGITSFANQIRREFDKSLRADQRSDFLSMIAAVLVSGASFVAWLSAARGMRGWRAQLLDSFHRCAEAEENLRKSNTGLEVGVKERTAELATANEALQAENTERKRGEEALRASAERYRSLFEGNPNPMWVFDLETLSFLAVNDAAVRHYGYSQEEFLTMTLKDIRPPEDIPALMDVLTCANDAMNSSVCCRHRRKDDALIDVEVTSHVLVWGERRARVVVINDVTERQRTEDRLREQAKLLDLAQDAIMVRDMEDRVEFWNHGAEKLYGWSAAEVHCTKASSFLYEDGPAAIAATQAAVIENGKWTGECKHACKDGGTVTVQSRWTLVRDELGAPKSILVINTDITLQKKNEEQFLRAQRLESIGTLASGVAHDLNNILVPILMAAPLLRGDVPAGERENLLAIVESSAERGASIVKQVLMFARGADGDRLLLQPIYLVQEIVKIAAETFPKSVAVRTAYPEDLWTIVANPTQLHQILLNLCINARDAMPTGGTLTLALENFEVDDHYASMTPGAKAGPHVLLEVSDTGTGIPREIIDKIFDPFFTTKELGQGTGLGLSTVIGIVKSHGGFMQVYSEVGRGTNFKVFLPANTGQLPDAQTIEAAPSPPAHGELLLIVDDEGFILQVAKALLENHGYRVLTAADATEALAIFALRMNEIDLVLTDLAMPFMDGVALIRTLQKMKPDVRVIASTGRDGQGGREKEIALLNVRASLTKPYNRNKLLATLHDILSPQTDK